MSNLSTNFLPIETLEEATFVRIGAQELLGMEEVVIDDLIRANATLEERLLALEARVLALEEE